MKEGAESPPSRRGRARVALQVSPIYNKQICCQFREGYTTIGHCSSGFAHVLLFIFNFPLAFFFFLEEGLKQDLAMQIGMVQMFLPVVVKWQWFCPSEAKKRKEQQDFFVWMFCSRNLNGLLESKVSLFLVLYFTEVVEIKKIY